MENKRDLIKDKKQIEYLFNYHGADWILEALSEHIIKTFNKFELCESDRERAKRHYVNLINELLTEK